MRLSNFGIGTLAMGERVKQFFGNAEIEVGADDPGRGVLGMSRTVA